MDNCNIISSCVELSNYYVNVILEEAERPMGSNNFSKDSLALALSLLITVAPERQKVL